VVTRTASAAVVLEKKGHRSERCPFFVVYFQRALLMILENRQKGV